jgi:Trypsin
MLCFETKMKKLLLGLILGFLIFPALFVTTHKHKHTATITPERKATHMITYYDENGKRIGLCTGTAVGPHALLTAVHCDEGEDATPIISLDLSVKKFHIIGYVADDRDHIIYHLDGPEFTNTVTIKERKARLGETVTSYGNGREDFPQHTYFGNVVVDDNGGDTSDVDAADGVACFSIPAIPGDSGSAVYGTDGNVVALITYGAETEDGQGRAVGFALNFSPEVLEEIKK